MHALTSWSSLFKISLPKIKQRLKMRKEEKKCNNIYGSCDEGNVWV